MTAYSLLLLAHLVLFAYWLGGDIGVFYSAYSVCDPKLSKESRTTALKIMMWVDMVPRYCLVSILVVGITMAGMMGWFALPNGVVPALWIGGAAWLWMVWAIHHHQGKPLAETLRRIDFAVRIVVILAMVGLGLAGLAGAGPINQPWLALKALLFGLLVGSGLMIRVMIAPFGPAFGEIMRSAGPAPDAEARLAAAMARARPFVVTIWIGLVAMAYLGAVKPPLG
jgi:hypothetical protein